MWVHVSVLYLVQHILPEGSLGHEQQDAATYAQWGADYVKVDWCEEGYDWYNGGDAEARARFIRMGAALHQAGRPMVYSVSAPGPTWRWAAAAGANLWRTSIDIKDNWDRMSNNGSSEDGLERFAAPDAGTIRTCSRWGTTERIMWWRMRRSSRRRFTGRACRRRSIAPT